MPLNSFKEKKNCKDLGVGKNLTEFAKIPMPESLKNFIIFDRTHWITPRNLSQKHPSQRLLYKYGKISLRT